MEGAHPSRGAVRFGVFEVDLRVGELRKKGIKVKLQDQPFQILQVLLERSGEVVTREELRGRIWPADTFVDFDQGLNNAIKRLRESLSDSPTTHASSKLSRDMATASLEISERQPDGSNRSPYYHWKISHAIRSRIILPKG